REYFADEASAVMTRDPNALSSALVKIAYGLAVQQDQVAATRKSGRAFDPAASLAGLGISSMRASSGFAMAAADATGRFSPGIMARVMQWDLKNPWARWFEFNSTHPLTARRIEAMSRLAQRMQIPPLYSIESNESAHVRYTGNLPRELLVTALPAIGGLVGLVLGIALFRGLRAPGWLGLAH